MHIDVLLDVFRANPGEDAVVWRDHASSYAWLTDAVGRWTEYLRDAGVAPGAVVSLEADFSPSAIALSLALVEHGCIIVPLTPSVEAKKPEFRAIAEVEATISIAPDDRACLRTTGVAASHELFGRLRSAGHPGLVLFSSGSTGTSKAAVHDFVPLLEKFTVRRHSLRTLAFLLFDHIGGVNTLLYVLSNAGCVVTVPDRSPEAVCAAVERHRVQLLPTSPTFINLLLMSEACKHHDLSSLEMVTYGTEVMSESTLRRFHELFPRIRLLQTYGLSEVGILRSRSRSSDSLWVKVGGEGFETRVVDGMLQIRARSAMLGYLNASSPFTSDGWLATGDAVEVDGEYLRIRGRQSEIINVGGEKVYPVEVESVLQCMEGVRDVTVSGEPNPITGQIVTATVRLTTGETAPRVQETDAGLLPGQAPTVQDPPEGAPRGRGDARRAVQEDAEESVTPAGAPARSPERPVTGRLHEIDAADGRDVAAITRLHLALLGHGPMARLGELFLRRFCYGALLRDGLVRAALFEVDGRPAGFVAYTSRSITFHRQAIRRHWASVGWLIALSAVRDPRLVARLLKAVRLMLSRRAEARLGRDPLGEVLAIGVLPEYRTAEFVQRTALRIGEELVAHVVSSLRGAGVDRVRMVVDAWNKPALLFYHRLGGRFEPYEHAGDPMVQVWFQAER